MPAHDERRPAAPRRRARRAQPAGFDRRLLWFNLLLLALVVALVRALAMGQPRQLRRARARVATENIAAVLAQASS